MSSWFYLTLRRTPAEAYDADIEIEVVKEISADVQINNEHNVTVDSSLNISVGMQMENEANVVVDDAEYLSAQIDTQDADGIDIVTKTEVEWIVTGN